MAASSSGAPACSSSAAVAGSPSVASPARPGVQLGHGHVRDVADRAEPEQPRRVEHRDDVAAQVEHAEHAGRRAGQRRELAALVY